jgi:hypothetical protein
MRRSASRCEAELAATRSFTAAEARLSRGVVT